MDMITSVYATNVTRSPFRVPDGIDLLGFRRSPDILAPAKMPAVAGNNIPKRSCQFSLETQDQTSVTIGALSDPTYEHHGLQLHQQ